MNFARRASEQKSAVAITSDDLGYLPYASFLHSSGFGKSSSHAYNIPSALDGGVTIDLSLKACEMQSITRMGDRHHTEAPYVHALPLSQIVA